MATINIRKQGGAAIMTIPSAVMKRLQLDIGAELDVSVLDGAVNARPLATPRRKRYSLEQLLAGATSKTMRALNEETGWARDGEPVGREV